MPTGEFKCPECGSYFCGYAFGNFTGKCNSMSMRPKSEVPGRRVPRFEPEDLPTPVPPPPPVPNKYEIDDAEMRRLGEEAMAEQAVRITEMLVAELRSTANLDESAADIARRLIRKSMTDVLEDFPPEVLKSLRSNAAKFLGVKQKVAELEQHDAVNSPAHYAFSGLEPIEAIEKWGLGLHLGNALKYIVRLGRKNPDKWEEDARKALWYIERYIKFRKSQEGAK